MSSFIMMLATREMLWLIIGLFAQTCVLGSAQEIVMQASRSLLEGTASANLPDTAGALLVKLDIPNLTYSTLTAVQVAELQGAYARNLAVCVGTTPDQVMDVSELSNVVTVMAGSDSDGYGSPLGTIIKGIILVKAPATLKSYGIFVAGPTCSEYNGLIYKTTELEVGPYSIYDLRLYEYTLIADQPLPWYLLWWVWLIISILLCIIAGVIWHIFFNDKEDRRDEGLMDSDGPNDFDKARDFDAREPLNEPDGALPFPTHGMAEMNTRKPIEPPYPNHGYGVAVNSGPASFSASSRNVH